MILELNGIAAEGEHQKGGSLREGWRKDNIKHKMIDTSINQPQLFSKFPFYFSENPHGVSTFSRDV